MQVNLYGTAQLLQFIESALNAISGLIKIKKP